MNPKSIFNLFSPKGKAQTGVQQGVATLILSSVALSLLALTACKQVVPASDPVAAVAPPQAEASGQHRMEALPDIDPADRKFFSPGYGAQTVKSGEAEALPAIDPADRKFFTPGYGVDAGGNDLTAYHQSEWDRTPTTGLGVEENALAVYHQSEWDRTPNTVLGIEALSKIDPADRKFFSPGYGVQTISDNGSEAILPQ